MPTMYNSAANVEWSRGPKMASTSFTVHSATLEGSTQLSGRAGAQSAIRRSRTKMTQISLPLGMILFRFLQAVEKVKLCKAQQTIRTVTYSEPSTEAGSALLGGSTSLHCKAQVYEQRSHGGGYFPHEMYLRARIASKKSLLKTDFFKRGITSPMSDFANTG